MMPVHRAHCERYPAQNYPSRPSHGLSLRGVHGVEVRRLRAVVLALTALVSRLCLAIAAGSGDVGRIAGLAESLEIGEDTGQSGPETRCPVCARRRARETVAAGSLTE